MENLGEVLKYSVPSMVVFLTAYVLLRAFFQREAAKRKQELLIDRIRISLPIRLQAYERVLLFLERISLQNLVIRLHRPEYSAADFHKILVQAVRDEYSHNLSQQLYLSVQAWEKVKNAKEDVIRQINTALAQLGEKDTATDLSNKLLEMSTEKNAVRNALDFLKSEAAKVF